MLATNAWRTVSRMALLLLCLSLVACDDEPEPQASAGKETAGQEQEDQTPVEQACMPAWMAYPHLLGSVHEHSGYSDGAVGTTPTDYFAAGREAGLAFMASSDHSDNLRLPVTANTDCLSPELPDCLQLPTAEAPLGGFTKWEQTARIADEFTDEAFTAIRGFEWTSDRFGHINVFFSQNELNAKTTDGYLLSMEGFWFWFGLDPALLGGSDGLLVFNHPGREDAIQTNFPDSAYAFNGFEFRPQAAERAVGIEVFGKSDDAYDTDNSAPPEGWYAFALDRGWRLAPVGAEDEHGTAWAQPERAKTIVITPDRSRDGIRQAMLQRRFYALAQHHNNLRLSFHADHEPMGSIIARPAGAQVPLQGDVLADFPQGGHLELVSNAGEIVATAADHQLAHIVSVDSTRRWYYLRVMNAEGRPVAYSSPVWVEQGEGESACP